MASEEEFSDDLEPTETLVQGYPKRSQASPRLKSASKKGKRGQGAKKSVYGSSGNPYGSTKGSKDLAAGRTTQKYWTDTLRHTGQGFTTQTANMQSFSGLKKTGNMGYSSTSHFLRQTVGTEKTPRTKVDKSIKAAPGTPAYKSPEEYYDQILELKKQIQSLNHENSNMKSKVGRLEKDNIKKEKEIEQLLDPSKSEEMRRTLADKRPDTGVVMHSLKQKILKLEKQLKEKEAEYNKLQSDVKTTKIEEIRIEMEAYYKEVMRLNQVKSVHSPVQKKNSPTVKESPSRLKALQDTIMKMNEKNYNLQLENKTLKEDLDKNLENHKKNKDLEDGYQDMNKRELLTAIDKLEKRLEKNEETTSMMSEIESRSGAVEGKVTLQGSAAQRMDQLDKRETELLDELKKKNDMIKKLKEDRAHYRKKCEEKDKEIVLLKKDIADLHGSGSNRKSPRVSPRRRSNAPPSVNSKNVQDFREKYAAKTIQKNWRAHRTDQDQEEHRKKVTKFRENHAAKNIQNQWRGYKNRKNEEDEATELIQAYMRAHQTRSRTLAANRNDYYDDDDVTSETHSESAGINTVYKKQMKRFKPKKASELDEDTVLNVQSTLRGHLCRKTLLKYSRSKPIKASEVDEDTVLYLQSTLRGHLCRKTLLKSSHSDRPTNSKGYRASRNLDSAGESEESDDIRSTLGSSFSRSASVTAGHSAPSKYNKRRTPPPAILSDDDDDSDDDIIMPKGKGKKLF